MNQFVKSNKHLEITPYKLVVGRKFSANQIIFENYAVTFHISGNVELADVLEVLKKFGQIGDITWKTHENTAIKTGEHTVYLGLADPLPMVFLKKSRSVDEMFPFITTNCVFVISAMPLGILITNVNEFKPKNYSLRNSSLEWIRGWNWTRTNLRNGPLNS